MTKTELVRAAAFLNERDDFLIGTHRRPDGDTIGSAAALCRALRTMGKTAYVLPNTQITPRFAPFLAQYERPEGWEPQHVVTVDVADTTMFSPNPECYEKRVDLAIDHHESNPGFAKQNLIASEYSSCGEVVYELLNELGVAIDEDIALALYLSVSTDTGCFRYSNTNVHSHLLAAVCMNYDIDFGELNRRLFETKSRARISLEQRVLNGMQFFKEGQISLITVSQQDISETGVNWDDMDSISSLPRQVEGVEAAITLTEQSDGKVKVSLRTNRFLDAAAITKKFGGGGHRRAAGAAVRGTLLEVSEKVRIAVEEMYEQQERNSCH